MADPEYYEKRKQAIRRGLQNGGPAGGKAAEIAFNEQHRPQKKTYKCLICGKEIKSKNILDFNVHASTEHRECFYDEKGNRIHDKRLRDYVEVIRFGIIRHTATKNLQADGYIRWPYRLWTNRRYINGIMDAAEELIGDAKLEYVIEGVMEDIQTFLFANGITSYEQWYTIEDVPVAIRRAATYGTVASLYSRHTNTWRSRVIPSVAPLTVTVKGDAQMAMEHWEGRYELMLERYLTAINSDKLLVSTADQEPVFDKELSDIPPGVTSSEYWYEWVNRTEGELSE